MWPYGPWPSEPQLQPGPECTHARVICTCTRTCPLRMRLSAASCRSEPPSPRGTRGPPHPIPLRPGKPPPPKIVPFAAAAALRLRPSRYRWSGNADAPPRRRAPRAAAAPWRHIEFAAAGLCPALIGRTTSGPARFKVQLALCRASGRGPVAQKLAKLNILFDHASGLFKMLDHTEPN